LRSPKCRNVLLFRFTSTPPSAKNDDPHILPTGAGFSYNWGGYLANEAFDYLLGVTETDDDLRRLL
jgi:hypothetical protein